MLKKGIIFLCMFAIFGLVGCTNQVVEETFFTGDAAIAVDTAKEVITTALTEDYSKYYDVDRVVFNHTKVENVEDNQYDIIIFTTLYHTPMTKFENTPLVKGVLEAANLVDFKYVSPEKTKEALEEANEGILTKEQIEIATEKISDIFIWLAEEVEGIEINEVNFVLKATMEIEDGVVDEDTVKLYTENEFRAGDQPTYTLIENGFIDDENMMIEKGKKEFRSWISN